MNFCIWFSALYNSVWRDVNSNALFGARRWLFVPCWPFSPHATAPVYFYFKIDLLAGSRSRRARWQMFYCSITPSRVEYNLLFFTQNVFLYILCFCCHPFASYFRASSLISMFCLKRCGSFGGCLSVWEFAVPFGAWVEAIMVWGNYHVVFIGRVVLKYKCASQTSAIKNVLLNVEYFI